MKFKERDLITLREIRVCKGIKQKELAKIFGVSSQFYCDMEAGRRMPNIDTLHRMAVFFGTSMDFMYHVLHRQRVIWNFPDSRLEYGMRVAMECDMDYLRAHYPPSGLPDPGPDSES